jgi:hypothetical protein
VILARSFRQVVALTFVSFGACEKCPSPLRFALTLSLGEGIDVVVSFASMAIASCASRWQGTVGVTPE